MFGPSPASVVYLKNGIFCGTMVSFANLTAQHDVAAHQTHELPADGKAESRARLLRSLSLLEMTEQLVLFVRRNARSRVLDFNPQQELRRSLMIHVHAQSNSTLLGKFDGVAQHADEDQRLSLS